jgi:hypothetical protein
MKISRRNFLGGVTGTAAALFSFQPIRADQHSASPGRELDCDLLDLKSHCALPESLQGYQAALAGAHNHLPETWAGNRYRCRTVIVPGLGLTDPAMADALSDLVNDGACLLLESGAGFLSPAEFATHRKMLHRHFNLAVEPPVDLWPGKSGVNTDSWRSFGRHPRKTPHTRGLVPYVSYVWPQETKVRDFSRIVPVSLQTGDVIGSVGAMPVALKKRVGKGTLIFLGSPLGPALGASDLEARRWLQSVTAF